MWLVLLLRKSSCDTMVVSWLYLVLLLIHPSCRIKIPLQIFLASLFELFDEVKLAHSTHVLEQRGFSLLQSPDFQICFAQWLRLLKWTMLILLLTLHFLKLKIKQIF